MPQASLALNNQVTIKTDAQYRYIKSNGIPDHTPGQLPNNGNPNTISTQNHAYRVPLNPQLASKTTPMRGPFGVALNGVPFDPATAEFYNNERSSGWNYDALSGKINLGLDRHNAHVQPTGAYHYHGLAHTLGNRGQVIGYTSDGFTVVIDTTARSSYKLKKGIRPSGPGGRYDGTYVQDFEYVAGAGDLDDCKGRTNSEVIYQYVLGDHFPFIPRCLKGTPDSSFARHGQGAQRGQSRGNSGSQSGRKPPREASKACASKRTGSSCSFTGRHGKVKGTCSNLASTLACKPKNPPRR